MLFTVPSTINPVYFSCGCSDVRYSIHMYIIYTLLNVGMPRWTYLTVPVGLCLMRKRKGLSTVTQGGEDRASKMAAKHKSKNIVKPCHKL